MATANKKPSSTKSPEVAVTKKTTAKKVSSETKTTSTPVAKKVTTKTATTKATVAKATATKEAAPKKAPAKASAKKIKSDVSPEQRYHMICTAAYYLAEQRGFAAGYEAQDWISAEAQIDAQLKS